MTVKELKDFLDCQPDELEIKLTDELFDVSVETVCYGNLPIGEDLFIVIIKKDA